jgi:hypothetical protein
VPSLPVCDGADYPLRPSPTPYLGNPWWYLRSSESDVLDFWAGSEAAADATGCPARTDTGDSTTLAGDCSVEGVEFAGSWSVDGDTQTMDEVSVALDVYGIPSTFYGDGRFTWAWVSPGDLDAGYTVSADGVYSRDGGGTLDGWFRFDALQVSHSAEAFTATGAVEVEWDYGHGRYCPTVAFTAAPDCPQEPDGYWALQASDTWIVVADGSARCDGCVELFRNGNWEGTACDYDMDMLF